MSTPEKSLAKAIASLTPEQRTASLLEPLAGQLNEVSESLEGLRTELGEVSKRLLGITETLWGVVGALTPEDNKNNNKI